MPPHQLLCCHALEALGTLQHLLTNTQPPSLQTNGIKPTAPQCDGDAHCHFHYFNHLF